MAQSRTRTNYWKFSDGKWMKQLGNETQAQAQTRFNGNPSLAVSTTPIGTINDGSIDICNENEVRGWSINPIDSSSAYVDIWINGVVVETVYGNQIRTDISDVFGLPSNAFGWVYIVPQQYKLPGVSVRATLKGRTDDFSGSPQLMASVGTTTIPSTTITTVPVTTSTTINGSTTSPITTTLNQNSLDTAVGPKPFYAGQIDWDISNQSDTNFLDLEIVEVNGDGLIRMRNKAPNRNPDNGRSPAYVIRTQKPVADIETRWFEPFQPVTIEFLWVDWNVPEYSWQAEHQPYNFFKADATIQFK